MPLAVGGNKFHSPVLSNICVLPDIWSDIYFEIVGPTAFLSVRTDGPTVFGKSVIVMGISHIFGSGYIKT
jgi:hypothetical protein